MDLETLLAVVKILGSIGAAWAAIVGLIRFVVRPFKTWRERKRELNEKIDSIYYELRPNGGGSMRDAVTKIEATVAKIETWQKTRLNHEGKMFFDADSNGEITWVNKETVKQLRATESEFLGFGYRNFIAKKDRARMIREIEEATKAEIDLKTSFTSVDGRCFSCELLVVMAANKTVSGYTGVLTVRGSELCF